MHNAIMIPHAGITHASGWIIIKKIQVAITQEVSTIRNNLIFANNGLGAVVFIFIVMFSLLFMQDSDFVWKTFLLLGFIKRWMVDRFEYESPFGQKKNADRRMFLRHRRFLVVRCEVGL